MENNSTILTSAYLNGTNDYQQRIPDPTQHTVSETMNALFDPMNAMYRNQFIDILVNRIGMTYVRAKHWTNKLAAFKGAKMNYGQTIQELAPKWIRAHSYTDDAKTLFAMHRPEVAQWFHSQNRRDKYEISVNDMELRTAFTDEYGLNNLVSQILGAPMNSDEYDEYRLMIQLIAEYENKWGFYKHQLSAAPTDEATGREFLTEIQAYAGMLEFPSTLYNAKSITDVPVFVQPNELILMMTPRTSANINVNTLASVFQLTKAEEVNIRKVIVDEFPVPNTVALLTTPDFFVCNDTLYETRSFANPETLTTNYYLHHWGVYSVSPFVPAIMFTTDTGTNTPVITQKVTEISVTVDKPAIDAGDTATITTALTGTISPVSDAIKVAPNSVRYALTAVDGDGKGVKLNYRTYVDEYGVLHTAKALKSGTVITVACESTYVNPSGATTDYAKSVTVTIN